MKTYEQLTKAEKEKLLIYTNIANGENTQSTIVAVISYIGIFISLPLIFLGSFRYFIVGTFILAISAAVTLIDFYYLLKRKKQFKLIFNIDDMYKDVFDVKDSDIRNMKRKVIWEKR
jgi:hypothetical protein